MSHKCKESDNPAPSVVVVVG